MDVVRKVNEANLILPAGDVKIGPLDYNVYTNSQIKHIEDIDQFRSRRSARPPSRSPMSGTPRTPQQIQTNIVRVDGQRSVYLPVLKQGGDANTIAIVDGIKKAIGKLARRSKQLVTKVVFDQSHLRQDGHREPAS